MAVAGKMAGPYPSKASEAMRRSPSISAAGCRVMPSGRVAESSSSRKLVPGSGNKQLHLGEVLEGQRRSESAKG